MNLVALNAPGDPPVGLIGGKARSLHQLMAWGLPVPDGFVVTIGAYADHARRIDLTRRLSPLLARNDYRGASALALELITGTPLSADLEKEVMTAWRSLGSPPVAVRSSATAEDLPNASFAGQYDSFLDVGSPDALKQAVLQCWASLWSERATHYRAGRRMAPDSVQMAVVVQRMVPATVAGVIFTVDPLTQCREQMLLEAVPGLGESLVSGRARGESCILDRRKATPRPVGAPARMIPPPSLRELARLALQIEARAGCPQDIEFALAGGRLFILQARPITTLAEPVPAPPPPSYMDRRMQVLTLERYAIAPRPLDNISFVRMVGAAAYTAQQFGLLIDDRDSAEFRRTIWHERYRLPRSRMTLRLFLHPFYSFGVLGTDWLHWWKGGPRERLRTISELGDLSRYNDAQLFERTEEILKVWEELTNRRFYAVSSVQAEFFLECLVTLAVGRKASARTTGDLLSGIAAMPTIETNDALWELSRLAREDAPAAAAIRLDKWEDIPEGSAFSAALPEFLARFGHRESGGFYISLPTWRHDPTPVRQIIRSLLDVEQRPARSASAHQEARDLVERRLRWCPWLRRRFVTLLGQVRALHLMREESHFDILRPLDALQSIAAEFGRRLSARGLSEADDDVFYLTLDEIRQWLLSGVPAGTEPAEFISRRRATYRLVNARWQRNRPQPKAGGKVLRGTSASPGRVRGVARIIADESRFNQLRPGEILVCPYSNPSWTPLFMSASAVVSETGGAASHAAIIAREYGLPAVLGITGATQLIRDGELIEVDGDRGVVRLPEAEG